MDFIVRMRWWQWIAVSLALGAMLGYLNSGPANPPVDHSSTSPLIFETAVVENSYVDAANERHPMVSGILIHPIETIQAGGKTVQDQLVTFTAFVQPSREHPSGSSERQAMLAPYPYEPQPRFAPSLLRWQYPGVTRYVGHAGDTLEALEKYFYHAATVQGRRAIINANPSLRGAKSASDLKIRRGRAYWIPWNPTEGHTVADFLDAANKMAAHIPGEVAISYRIAWWELSNYVYEIWMLGSFLLVGVIWPGLLRAMGAGRVGQIAEKPYEWKADAESPKASAVATAVTEDDLQRLRELEKTMMSSLASEPAPAAAAQPPAAAAAQVKKLNAEPVQTPPAPAAPEDKKSYEGEFYPVARPSGEKKE